MNIEPCEPQVEEIDYDILVKDGHLTEEQVVYIKEGKKFGFEPNISLKYILRDDIDTKYGEVIAGTTEFLVELYYLEITY